MERIWAPWRLEYVSVTDCKHSGCVFCCHTQEQDEEKRILHRGKHSFVIMNIFPYNNGHIMIAPYNHVSSLSDLSVEEMCEMMELLRDWTDTIKKSMHCHGFNIGLNLGRIAGAGIADHMHIHIVPRWDGDTNFMPVIADIKVIPQSLDSCYKLLKQEWREKQDAENQ